MPRENEDNERGRSRGASHGRSQKTEDRGHGGWFGDSEGHSEAAKKGWGEEPNDKDEE